MFSRWMYSDRTNAIFILTIKRYELLCSHVVGLVLVSSYENDRVVSQKVYVIAFVWIISEHRVKWDITLRNFGILQLLGLIAVLVEFINTFHICKSFKFCFIDFCLLSLTFLLTFCLGSFRLCFLLSCWLLFCYLWLFCSLGFWLRLDFRLLFSWFLFSFLITHNYKCFGGFKFWIKFKLYSLLLNKI